MYLTNEFKYLDALQYSLSQILSVCFIGAERVGHFNKLENEKNLDKLSDNDERIRTDSRTSGNLHVFARWRIVKT